MKKNIQYALISALILWLAWPPMPYTAILLLIGLFPLLVAIDQIVFSDTKNKNRKVFFTAGTTFLIWNTASVYWIWNASAPGAVVAYILGALLMTLAFSLYAKIKATAKPFTADLFLIGFWISYEYLHQSWDLNFPWMTLGNGFASTTPLVQWYEYTGVYGGTFWILLANIILFRIWKSKQETSKFNGKLMAYFTLIIAIPIIFSLVRYNSFQEENNAANITVIQPNIDPYSKYESFSTGQQLDKLITLSQGITENNTEFIIWPETAIPEYIAEDKIRETRIFNHIQSFLRNYPNTTLITGAETYLTYNSEQTPSAKLDKNNNIYWDSFNTALTIETSSNVQFYHKSKLVPGVEKMPFTTALGFLKPLFSHFGGTTGGYGYQNKPSVLYSRNGIGVGTAICYESIWGNWVAGYVKEGAQFIAIITNDGWWGNTAGKDQHLLYAKLRAIETRRWVARSANTGISAFINQRGDIVQQSNWWVEAALKQDINLSSDLTFYVKNPDLIVFPFLLIGFIGLISIIKQRFTKKIKA